MGYGAMAMVQKSVCSTNIWCYGYGAIGAMAMAMVLWLWLWCYGYGAMGAMVQVWAIGCKFGQVLGYGCYGLWCKKCFAPLIYGAIGLWAIGAMGYGYGYGYGAIGAMAMGYGAMGYGLFG